MTDSGGRPPYYPVFIVLPQAGARLSTLSTLLSPLMVTARAGRMSGVDLYYRGGTDMALLALRFDARFTTSTLVEQLSNDAARVSGAILDPSRLPTEQRRRFFTHYLPQYDVRIVELGDIDAALRALANHLDAASPAHGRSIRAVEVRFRRGDAWQLARVRSLTQEGISLATGAPPRRGDIVDLEITVAGATTIARGAVVGVTSSDAASVLGAAGFGARFLVATHEEQAALERILTAHADGGRLLTPPPRRRESRYPVRWPVLLRTPRGKAEVAALDVSRHGLFIGVEGCTSPPQATSVYVTVPIEDRGGEPIQATARIARAICDDTARERGLAAGYGLELVTFRDSDDGRFAAFVNRVGKRTEKNIVVGAAPWRLDAILAELASAGYMAAGASDPPTLVAKAAAPACAPDLVVLDSSLSDVNPRGVSAARRALSARAVSVLLIDGDSPADTRAWADQRLLSA